MAQDKCCEFWDKNGVGICFAWNVSYLVRACDLSMDDGLVNPLLHIFYEMHFD